MVKAKAMLPDGRAMVILGISDVNVQRLKVGDPIYFESSTLRIASGTPLGPIVLFYGKDDDELERTLKTLIGPKTEVVRVPRGDERPT